MVVNPKRSLLPDAIEQYLTDSIRAEPGFLTRLREETALLPESGMQIGVDQAALLGFLLRLIGARKVLEIGTFTGLSALAMALSLPADGRVITCDISADWTAIGRRYWEEAGVVKKIDLRLAPAAETLAALERSPARGTFDFAFIDGDKGNYDRYYESCLNLVRPGGIIALDNMLWSGKVADPANTEESTVILRALNAKVRDDSRVDAVLLSVGDGLLLVSPRLR
jgi:predicted O-methyltransferase YrrM